MKYERFEQLPVWQAPIDLARRVYALTSKGDSGASAACATRLSGRPSPFPTTLRKALSAARRRSCSRSSTLRAAPRAKCAPCSACWKLCRGSKISNLKSRAEAVSRQLRDWADSLQNSKITGQGYLNQKTRQAAKVRKDREEFLEKLAQLRHAPSNPED